jgi:hypothetical protein
MPRISGPSMPSMPTLSTGTGSNSSSQNTTTNKATTEAEKSSTEKVEETKAGYALTAQTISSLSGNSDLSTLSGLLGGDASSLYGNLTGLDSTTSSYNTNLLLSQILDKLNKIAENQGTLETEESSENVQVAAKKTSSGILRFRFNNYEFVSSLSDVYISSPEADGTFFVTGDRTYFFGNGQSRETFYMLFKNENGNNFEVAVALNQNDENQNSFLYKFAKDSPYKSQRTGNLFFINSNKNDLKIDILIEN